MGDVKTEFGGQLLAGILLSFVCGGVRSRGGGCGSRRASGHARFRIGDGLHRTLLA